MDKEYIEKQIKVIEDGIKMSEDNVKNANNHIEEGKLILEVFRNALANCN
jgi:hypothetical protein